MHIHSHSHRKFGSPSQNPKRGVGSVDSHYEELLRSTPNQRSAAPDPSRERGFSTMTLSSGPNTVGVVAGR